MGKQSNSEEEFIASEGRQAGLGENSRWVNTITAAFPALQNRNYKLYFSGQLISLIGTWLQIVAQGWLVLQLTQSAFLIGLIAALSTFPSMLFSLFGGVIVDRFPKRHIILFTQSVSMILALILGILTLLQAVSVWQIGLIAFLLGTVNAIDAPARQAFVSEMVNKEQLPSAIALNSAIFNAARVIGPSIAGLLIALIGTGGAFIVNALSYIAVLFALLSMRLSTGFVKRNLHPIKAIREGLSYSYTHPIIRTLVLFTGITSIFGWSYTTVMPLIAQKTFHLGAQGLGYLYAASGLGSLVAALVVATLAKRISPVVFILGGNMLFTLSLIGFSFTSQLHVALPLLFLVGLGLLSQFAMMNTVIQRLVRSELRGRVMSIYIFMFVGLTPVGNFQVGWIAERMGTAFAIRLGAIIIFLFAGFILIYQKKIRQAYRQYKEEDGETGQ